MTEMTQNEISKRVKEKEDYGRGRATEEFGEYYIFAFLDIESYQDFEATGLSVNYPTYYGEIKAYGDPEHPRWSWGTRIKHYNDYQIDYYKIEKIVNRAKKDGRIPILMVFFMDKTVVWDLRKIKWQDRKRWEKCNSTGVNYGGKELKLQTWLYLSEAVYNKPNDKWSHIPS